jgi:CDGSH-type Zn-finger protein/uncharacterized Fe-S cluster protein YjdI
MNDSESSHPAAGAAKPAASPVKRYVSLSIYVDYEARRCIHAAVCVRGLPSVFDRERRPWVLPSAASADKVARVVEKCPSGALHFVRTDGGPAESAPDDNTIVPRPSGPLHVRGRVQLRSPAGGLLAEDLRMSLCRCGQSRNKPFCDQSHRAAGFSDPGNVPNGGVAAERRTDLTITPTANGPYLIEGALILRSARGDGQHQSARVELCRCGASRNKPFCDGSHEVIGFQAE